MCMGCRIRDAGVVEAGVDHVEFLTHQVFRLLNLLVDWTHDVADLKTHSANLDQVLPFDFVAGKIHLLIERAFYDLPNFFFRFSFVDLLGSFIYKIFMIDPVSIVPVKKSADYFLSLFAAEIDLAFLQLIGLNLFN